MKNGLTQSELGKLVGLGQARIAEIESKPGAISVDQLLQILSALGGGMLLDDGDGSSKPLVAAPVSQKRATKAIRSRDSSSGQYLQRELSSGSTLASRADKTAGTKRDLERLRDANPDATVTPTSRRNFVIRSKKGSW